MDLFFPLQRSVAFFSVTAISASHLGLPLKGLLTGVFPQPVQVGLFPGGRAAAAEGFFSDRGGLSFFFFSFQRLRLQTRSLSFSGGRSTGLR